MKSLIFGINGQDGYYLSLLLAEQGCEVKGFSRSPGYDFQGDVGDFNSVEKAIRQERPDYIFHFAADSTTKHDALFSNHNAISTGTLNILESVKKHSPVAKIFLSGSAMQFKNEGLPIDEQTPFAATSPYSVARIHSVYAGRYYREILGLNVYIGYFFNHDSPLRTERHINKKIVAAVKRIAEGSNEKIEIGDIEVKKEFNFAGDIMRAVWVLINQSKIFEAILGCGHTHSIRTWIEYCFNKIGKNWQDYVVIRQDFVPEYNVLVSNPQLIKEIGWKPETGFTQLADMMMEAK
jgi:GDPmannose 4,6-dehydratase